MCGIAGLIDPTAYQGDLRTIAARMAERLLHRGPDGGAVWSDDGVALSHRRLAILDTSEAGAQPMLSVCGRFVIAFNGEIYNHLDLRSELDQVGAAPVWKGHSDTETLLAAIVHWGVEETLRRSAGMFAIAVWDQYSRRLILARDRIGEKPLYWGWSGKALVFGSELKAIRAHPASPSAICTDGLAAYLKYGYVPAPYSIHLGLYKLEPGCLLEVAADALPPVAPSRPLRPGENFSSLSIRRYWSLDAEIEAGAATLFTDRNEAIAATETTLTAAIERQMIADVPLGAFLSGGVDSSLIVALMQAQSERPVQTFTVGFEAPEFDESPYANEVARHLGTDHTTLRVNDADARDIIPVLPALYDEPFADSSQIPTHLVCRAARTAVTVALSGDGGDELFGGYNRYILTPRLWQKITPVPFVLRRAIGDATKAVPEGIWKAADWLYKARYPLSDDGEAMSRKVRRIAERLRRVRSLEELYFDTTSLWKEPTRLMQHSTSSQTTGLLYDPLPNCLEADPAGRMMALDLRSYLPDDILCKVDRAAMGISLETRVPFLDPAVIRLSARLPTDLKIDNNQGKVALREVLYRHVPRTLIERPKTGFSVPLGAWLRGPLRGWAEDLLSVEALTKDGILDPKPIREAWSEHLAEQADRSHQLWIILMFMAWRLEQR